MVRGEIFESSESERVRARRPSSPVIIDGDGEADWADSELVALAQSTVSLAAQNDSDDVYLMIATADPRQAALLRTRGFSLSFDRGAGPAGPTEILLPPVEAETSPRLLRRRPDAPISIRVRRQNEPDRELPMTGAAAVEAAVGSRAGNHCHEMRVHLATLGARAGQEIGVRVQLVAPEPTGSDAEGKTRHEGRAGMAPPAPPDGSGTSRGEGPASTLPEPVGAIRWIRLRLAP